MLALQGVNIYVNKVRQDVSILGFIIISLGKLCHSAQLVFLIAASSSDLVLKRKISVMELNLCTASQPSGTRNRLILVINLLCGL